MFKPKDKLTIIRMGGLTNTTKQEVQVKQYLEDRKIWAVAHRGKRKLFNLNAMVNEDALLLRGWDLKFATTDGDSCDRKYGAPHRGFIGNGDLNFWISNPTMTPEDYTAGLCTEVEACVVGSTYPSSTRVNLFHWDREEMQKTDITEEFHNWNIPDMPMDQQPPAPPKRHSILTDEDKADLRAAEDRVTAGEPAKVLIKLFNPAGAGTWLLCSMEDDMDTLWSVCDLGQGCVEYGTVSLEELETTKLPMGLHIEKDKFFDRKNNNLSVDELTSMDHIPTNLQRAA